MEADSVECYYYLQNVQETSQMGKHRLKGDLENNLKDL